MKFNQNNIVTAPEDFSSLPHDRFELFLGGSIEMGKASNWQERLINEFVSYREQGMLRIYNPRRPDWDGNWGDEHPELHRQIDWELEALERVDHVLIYLEPGTLAPISLLEF